MIKESLDIIVLIKFEDKISQYLKDKKDLTNSINKYEALLRQEEVEIRKHIGEEQQLKLNIEKLQEKIDRLESGKVRIIIFIFKFRMIKWMIKIIY